MPATLEIDVHDRWDARALAQRLSPCIDRERREARDEHGETYAYERLLLATGGRTPPAS